MKLKGILYCTLLSLFCLSFFSCEKKPKSTSSTKKVVKPKNQPKSTTAKVDNSIGEAPTGDPTPPEHLEKARELLAETSDADIDAVVGKKVFKMYCATCHGFTGDLNVNGAKDLTKSKISMEERVAQVYFGKGLMTPFKDILEPAEIIAMGKYVETLRK